MRSTESVLAPEIGAPDVLTVVVTGPVRRTQFSLRVPAEVRRLGERRCASGSCWSFRSVGRRRRARSSTCARLLVAPRGPEDGFDERGWLARRGVHVVLRGGDWRVVGRRGGLGGLSPTGFARISPGRSAPGWPGSGAPCSPASSSARTRGCREELRDSFKASGLYHLLAVSGQNVVVLAGAVLVLAWLLGIPRLAAQVAVLVAIFAYVLAVGWQPSVVRAGVAGALASLAWLISRPRDRWHFLAVGAAVLLAWTPATLLEPGFQLSFAAVGAIFVVVPRVQRFARRLSACRAGIRDVIAISLACGAATAPILWLQFGSVPVYSLLANALVTFAIGAAARHRPRRQRSLEPLLPSAALALAWLNGWLAAYVATCARLVARLPFAQVGSLTAVCLLLGTPLAILLLEPAAALAAVTGTRVCRRGLAGGARLAALAREPAPTADRPPDHGARRRPGRFDPRAGAGGCGARRPGAARGPRRAAAPQSRRTPAAALVLTHPQRDHVGGAEEVLARIGVERVLDPRLPFPSPYEDGALRMAARRSVPVVEVRAGAAWRLGRLRVRALWPDRAGVPGADPNNHAVVLLASYGEVDALLTADAETDVTAPLYGRRIEILKVAHHGSADTGLATELRELRPAVAVISCGRNNDYGHPTPSTLAALRASPGLHLFRTDEDGRVVVESDGRRVAVRTER